ncbi:MAG: hypothetical protein OEW58_11275 [Gammaproteobacteria bacterium]|nr:hypothetical protein [Gammaproteobacteria bacterium]
MKTAAYRALPSTLCFVGSALFFGMNFSAHAAEDSFTDSARPLQLITGNINYRHRHSELFVGSSLKQVSFNIKQHNNGAHGDLQAQTTASYFFRLNSRAYFLDNSNFGSQLTATASTYQLDGSETDQQNQVLSEHLSGYYAYAGPVLFYLYGNRFQTRYFKAGIAPGLSMVNYKGKVALNADGTLLEADIQTPRGVAFQPSLNLLLESKWNNWSLLLSHSYYTLNGKTHELTIQESAATVAYSWTL